MELDESEFDSTEREDFENIYYELSTKLNHFSNSQPPPVNNQNNLPITSASNGNLHLNNRVRLPEINIPNFTGICEEWLPFYSKFSSLIHNNDTLSDVQKFHYLTNSLQGEAAEVIHSLELIAENYQEAWTIVTERYDNKRFIVQSHIKAIFDLPAMNKENHILLRKLLDGIVKHLRALTVLKRPTDSWDDLIIHIITNKIDPTTNKEWEHTLLTTDIPKLKELTDFLTRKCRSLESVAKRTTHQVPSNKVQHSTKGTTSHVTTSKLTCQLCTGDHYVVQCAKFLEMPIEQRISEMKQRKMCLNCLRTTAHRCHASSCRKCHRRHNTLLHLPPQTAQQTNVAQQPIIIPQDQSLPVQETTISNYSWQPKPASIILLSTALINIYDSQGKLQLCRALLDSGSQSSFITESLATRLNVNRHTTSIPVAGINQSRSHVNHTVDVTIRSRYNAFHAALECLVLTTITEKLPTASINRSDIQIPPGIKLADPEFFISTNIDLLIGAEIFWKLVCVGQIKTSVNQPILQKTHFGWIVSGKIMPTRPSGSPTICNLATTTHLDLQMSKFWEVEECAPQRIYSAEELECDQHFLNTMRRDQDGRFIVRLPLKESADQLGESRSAAFKRFNALENKLKRQPSLRQQYQQFMAEYEALGHMEQIPEQLDSEASVNYYLPHHGVHKQSSTTTKLRVVFDGSAKTSSDKSLNDILLVGPPIQQDLFEIIIRFRGHKYVVTADVEKMYRQIMIDVRDRDLQRIFWRPDINSSIKTYHLTTVTYGTASAPYLAMRCLRQIALEQQDSFPTASATILRDFYVDDLLTGADSTDEILQLRDNIIKLLKSARFELRKWASNDSRCLVNIPIQSTSSSTLFLDKSNLNKTLGLLWQPISDSLHYAINSDNNTSRITKRSVLSTIARIYDPLGLVGPVIVTAKIMMQRLWQLQVGWDESLPVDFHTGWSQFTKELPLLNNIHINRRVLCDDPLTVQLHGFCDASEAAYGACIYIRSTDSQGNIFVNLLCSKSRVAPLKKITLPKLELCGALLLAQLLQKTNNTIKFKIDEYHLWTDSTIVLAWLSANPNKWKTFTANRVAQIQDLTENNWWQHVRTLENPADLISRGVQPKQLQEAHLWWKGASWLSEDTQCWPIPHDCQTTTVDIPEQRTVTTSLVTSTAAFDIFNKYSSLTKLQRVIAYCIRFKHNSSNDKELRISGSLTTKELQQSLDCLVKIAQSEEFNQEIHRLQQGDDLNRSSKLLTLRPFIDETGLLRVGGRLQNSTVAYNQRHPIMLPKSHRLTDLIIQHEHVKHLHAGPQLLIASIRLQFWPLSIRNTVKKIIRNCLKCFRVNPAQTQPIMGNLPERRVVPSRPFINCGLDYAGPFLTREGNKRSKKTVKSYLAIFICFATKAVHIEVVSDLTTESFLQALRRFGARRGKCLNIYSDNATNFVGAKNELEDLQHFFANQDHNNKIITALAQDNINWHFIPPRSPHFGGLWEAAVKSATYRLKRVVGETRLSFEELNTIIVQIEACLNSRPITPISDDPTDLSVLTPAHFLIGDSLTAIPEKNLTELPINRLSRWQRVQQVQQHFWSRWCKEYLTLLQQRTKWKLRNQQLVQPDTMVLIRDDNLHPLQWQLGRINETHPGKDDVVRVVTVKTAKGTVKRAVAKICVLPQDTV